METPTYGEAFRSAMRRVPSVVTIITAAGDDGIRGVTIGSFTSVAVDPPLVSFNVGQRSRMHGILTAKTHFAVHLIGPHQTRLCEHFAKPNYTSAEQFGALRYRLDAHGVPILEDALAVLSCRRHGVFAAGDHSIFLGQVIEIDEANAGHPLLYYDRAYRSFGDAVARGSRRPPDPSAGGDGEFTSPIPTFAAPPP